jgi:hypothetical protein
MSSTTTTTTVSPPPIAFDAVLDDYTDRIGIDLTQQPFAAQSSDAIFDLLQDKAKAFKDDQDENRKLIDYFDPFVHVLRALPSMVLASGDDNVPVSA